MKKCFVPLYRAGQLPPRVDVKFTLQSSGRAGTATIQQAQYSGSDLERCLSGAIGQIEFPPSSGGGQKITYPFVLQ